MPAASSLARLQQALVLGLVALALAWVAWWSSHPAVAVLGAICILLVHAPVLALEFLLLRPA
ncbi:MAG: permease, partial [Ramlibacter sp.]